MKIFRAIAAIMLTATAFAANATYTIEIAEVGGNVVMTGSGSLNLTGLTINPDGADCGRNQHGLIGGTNSLCVGSGAAGASAANAFNPRLAIPTGNFFSANASSGIPFFPADNRLYLPSAYTSGSPISNSSTYTGTSLAAMGLTSDFRRVLTLPSGDTIVIGVRASAQPTAAPVPAMGEYALLAMTALLAMLGFVMLRRTKG